MLLRFFKFDGTKPAVETLVEVNTVFVDRGQTQLTYQKLGGDHCELGENDSDADLTHLVVYDAGKIVTTVKLGLSNWPPMSPGEVSNLVEVYR